MSVMDTVMNQTRLAAVRDLRATLQGKVVVRGDDDYAATEKALNRAVTNEPAFFAMCETAKDVKEAVSTARIYDLPLSVRVAGHDWTGRSLCHDNLVLDLSAMRRVRIDAAAQIATVEGGATVRDVVEAADPYGLVPVAGTVGSVGMVGFTLGGGYGPLIGKYGLALDNLVSAEIVLVNGQMVTANAWENPDLFWALRGGGGNFGVVTSMQIRLHHVEQILAGLILFPWSQAESVFRGYAELIKSAPEELSLIAGVFPGPEGAPAALLAPAWCGEQKQGDEIIASLKSLGTPLLAHIAPISYTDMLNMYDVHMVNGHHYAVQTRRLPMLNNENISTFIAAGNNRTSPLSLIRWHHFHGFPTRVPADQTAFGLRREHFMVEILSAWEPREDEGENIHREWARMVSQMLSRYALPGGNPNMPWLDEREQIAFAYGSNLARLQNVKQHFDPDDAFSSAVLLQAPELRSHA